MHAAAVGCMHCHCLSVLLYSHMIMYIQCKFPRTLIHDVILDYTILMCNVRN